VPGSIASVSTHERVGFEISEGGLEEAAVERWRELGARLLELDPKFFSEVSARVEVCVEARSAFAEHLVVLRKPRRL
jgi:hypothetical protein